MRFEELNAIVQGRMPPVIETFGISEFHAVVEIRIISMLLRQCVGDQAVVIGRYENYMAQLARSA